jgi:hypothetical protein
LPKVVEVTDDNMSWLRENHESVTLTEAADRIGVCVDTLKRILVREGLREFEGAKYVVARKEMVHTWTRPCMECGSTEERPKNFYYCRPCRAKRGYEDE